MLQTLGGLQLTGGFRRVKPLLALVYVSLEGPTTRRDLIRLLWPDARQPDSSLRVALYTVRERLGADLIREDPLEVSVRCDATELLRCGGEDALLAYTGPFLQNVDLGDVSAQFEDWVLTQRERLARHVQNAALQHAEQSAPAQAAALAEQVYRLPGAPPAEVPLLRRLLALSLPGSALEHDLHAELQELQADEPAPRRLARQAARMLGRAAELDELLAWAARPGGAVALVSGPGGIGKSTLARELLHELKAVGRQVTLLDAEGVRLSAELIPRLHAALPDEHGGNGAAPTAGGTWASLRALLPDRPVIVLDGTDELQDLPELLEDVRSALPEVRWVLTSRRSRLGMTVEGLGEGGLDVQAIHLGGLNTPNPEAELPDILGSAAVQLFAREAARVIRDYRVTPANAGLIAGIVRRLQGHPLALTLAAAWLQVESLEAVYARILQDAANLHDPSGDARRGLNVVAQRSWSLLNAAQQETLLRLSVFTDFDPADAPTLGLSEADLDALLEQSFLEAYLPGSERLRLYPALQGLVQREALNRPALIARSQQEHARHYLNWFLEREPESQAVDTERGNLLLAIQAALRHGTLGSGAIDHLLAHYDRRGLHTTGTEVFADLSDLAEDAAAPDDVQAAAQIATMWLAYRADRLLDAQTLAGRFLQGRLADDPRHRMKVLNTLASIRDRQGLKQQSADLTRQALEVARAVGDTQRIGMYLLNLILALTHLGRYAEARGLIPEAGEVFTTLPAAYRRRLDWLTTWVLLQEPEPDFAYVRARLLQEVESSIEGTDTESAAHTLYQLAVASLGLDLPREALAFCERARALCLTSEIRALLTSTYLLEARVYYALGRTPLARSSVLKGLHLALQRGDNEDLIELVLVVATDLLSTEPTFMERALNTLATDDRANARQQRLARALLQREPTLGSALDLSEVAQTIRACLSGP